MRAAHRDATRWAASGVAVACLLAGLPMATASAAAPAGASEPSGGWSATFTAEIGEQVDRGSRVLLVGAGDDAAPATKALRSALVASGRPAKVVDGTALGNLAALDDAAITQKAKGQRVDRIVIVRVFAGTPASGVVTFYDAEGTVVTALAVREGVPASTDTTAGVGIDGAAAKSVDELTDAAAEEEPSAAEQRFEQEHLWFEHWIGVEAGTGRVLSAGTVIKQGKYGRSLKRGDLYKITGRDDLLRKYRVRQGVRIGVSSAMFVTGIGMTVGGVLMVMRAPAKSTPDFGADDPIDMGTTEPTDGGSRKRGWAVLGVGLGLVTFAWLPMLVRPHPIRNDEAAKLVDEYNQGLRKKLGLPKQRAHARVGVGGGPSGGSLVFSGRF